jgi:hypothetical protein
LDLLAVRLETTRRIRMAEELRNLMADICTFTDMKKRTGFVACPLFMVNPKTNFLMKRFGLF